MADKRCHYPTFFKKQVILYADENGNRAAMRQFGVNESNIRRWRKDRVKISQMRRHQKANTGPKRGRFVQVEESVMEWILEKRNSGLGVTYETIRLNANAIARSMNIPRTAFKASVGWCIRFMRRHGLALRRRTSIASKLPVDFEDKLLEFQKFVINLRKTKDFLLGQIGNCDQTPVYFDMPENYTVEKKGTKTVTMKSCGYEKLRATVMLSCTADGRKLPPMIIFKRKLIPKKENFPKGIQIRVQEKGWMTNELMIDWFKTVWMKRPGADLALNNMLVLDAFRGHLTDDLKDLMKRHKCSQVVIPGGMTSILQPLDVSLNKPFKNKLKKFYSDWVSQNLDNTTSSGKIKRAPLSELANWVLRAWNSIPETMVAKAFKKCSISNALDGTEDGLLWEDSDEDDNYQPGSEADSSSECDTSSETEGSARDSSPSPGPSGIRNFTSARLMARIISDSDDD